MKARIEQLMLDFVGVNTDTNTAAERDCEGFFQRWFDGLLVMAANPVDCGFFDITGDALGRRVPYALVRGGGADTVILIHHSDCVDCADYRHLAHLARAPHELTAAFARGEMDFPADAQAAEADLARGDWLFGRGVADMKGGGAIHMALLEKYAADADFSGNVLLLSLVDEENLSTGMRGAVFLLKKLQKDFGLEYVLTIDSESHERGDDGGLVFYDGSIGKIMPIIYTRGKLAHTGMIFRGLNPINLLAEIIRRTELSPDFMEKYGNSVNPPPTWLFAKDTKGNYDVSLPDAAMGYMSVLTLSRTPREIMEMIREISLESFEKVISDMNISYTKYLELNGNTAEDLPWRVNVKYFAEIYQDALREGGEDFARAFKAREADICAGFVAGKTDMPGAVREIIEFTLGHIADLSPIVVLAMAPPYYPAVNNAMLGEGAARANAVLAAACTYTRDTFGEIVNIRNIYTGISDLSYSMFVSGADVVDYINDNMLMGGVYTIPLAEIKDLTTPVLNIGPWGRDIHKYTERVYLPDLYVTIPAVTDFIIREILKN